jgi:acetate kinase
MRILVVNCGSSTLKFELIDEDGTGSAAGAKKPLAQGIVDRIGRQGTIRFSLSAGTSVQEAATVSDHGEAMVQAMRWLSSSGVLANEGIEAAGHRVVHGGERFSGPTIIDDEVIRAIEELAYLAPLHNDPALMAIRAARESLGADVPMVAVFDTAFHRTMPDRASLYAIPSELAERHGIRRYGFHGIAHRYMAERYAEIVSRPLESVRIITLQLGNGCSAAAVEGGQSVETSMGLTPLEGLVMGTRSGDVDPSLAGFLSRRENVETREVEEWLNNSSGLLGVSGRSGDMRELLQAESEGDRMASLAIEMFCYRVRKYVGAYLSVLGGAEALVFGGGIGENAPEVRSRICSGMEWCGLIIDAERNAAAIGRERRISAEDASLHAYVVPVDEASVIARDTSHRIQRHERR